MLGENLPEGSLVWSNAYERILLVELPRPFKLLLTLLFARKFTTYFLASFALLVCSPQLLNPQGLALCLFLALLALYLLNQTCVLRTLGTFFLVQQRRPLPATNFSAKLAFDKTKELLRQQAAQLELANPAETDCVLGYEMQGRFASLSLVCNGGLWVATYKGTRPFAASRVLSHAFFESLGQNPPVEPAEPSERFENASDKTSCATDSPLTESALEQKLQHLQHCIDEPGWEVEERGADYTIWRRDDPVFITRKVTLRINVTLERFARLLADETLTPKYNPLVRYVREVNSYAGGLSLCHMEVRCPFPFSNRDFVMFSHARMTESSFCQICFSAPDELLPPTPRLVRGQVDCTAWLATAAEGGLSVTFLNRTDGKIYLVSKSLIDVGSRSMGRIPLVFRQIAEQSKA